MKNHLLGIMHEMRILKSKRLLKTSLGKNVADFLKKKEKLSLQTADKHLKKILLNKIQYLKNLMVQVKMIQLELKLGSVSNLRKQILINKKSRSSKEYMGGMQAMKLGQDLEFWPFEGEFLTGEYWADELGYYIYNLEDNCKKGS